MPACGYKVYYIVPGEKPEELVLKENDLKLDVNSIENQFYQINVNLKGKINVLDKISDVCFI
ncbi:MAG: hypothetical protein ACTSQU_10050 [Promethearchaeota archaeon]